MTGNMVNPSIDWSRPIEAVAVDGADRFPVEIDRAYGRQANHVPVKFPRNLWIEKGRPGTWYFDDRGLAFGGMAPEGYNGRYVVANIGPGNPKLPALDGYHDVTTP